jgi:DNA-binding response OmpR family regulator/tRNA A-37 threonylcarbamoyl transferase component Bud32
MASISRGQLERLSISQELLKIFTIEIIEQYQAFPLILKKDTSTLVILAANPHDKNATKYFKDLTNIKTVKAYKGDAGDLQFLIDKWYPKEQSVKSKKTSSIDQSIRETKTYHELKDMVEVSPDIKQEISADKKSGERTAKKRLMLIDDDRIQGRNAFQLLEKEHFDVDLSTSDTAVHRLMVGGSYDGVLIKQGVSIDRFELEQQIRQMNPNIEIHFISSYTTDWMQEIKDVHFRDAYFNLCDFFMTYLEERGPFKHGRSKRIYRYVTKVAERLELKQAERERISLATYFYLLEHLLKRTEFTGEDALNTQQSITGGIANIIQAPYLIDEILSNINEPIKDQIQSGRDPGGHSHIGAKIVKVVADFVDREEEGVGFEEIMSEFRNLSGKSYDPLVIETLYTILREDRQVEEPVEELKSILIVEPDSQFAQMLKLRFINEGFTIDKARDGKEALQKISAHPPDIILSEVLLPKLDGFTLCSTLKNEPQTADIPIIFISSQKDNHYINKGLNLGAEDYLTKPVNLDILSTKVRRSTRAAVTQVPTGTEPQRAQPVESKMEAFQSVSIQGFKEGALLGRRYEIISKLGEGGMGAVFKARDRALDEVIALKLLKQDLVEDQLIVERFKYEIKLARRISHPNVIRIHDFGELENNYFISMEFCEGKTLKEIMSGEKGLPLKTALHYFGQMLSAMSAAHSEGIIHRDLKPGNMIVVANNVLKILDFGLAKVANVPGVTITGQIFGTPLYMSPEQAQGQKLDSRSDIYSLGVMFYEMLTGKVPFHADNLTAILMKHINEDPVPPRKLNPSIPPAIEKLILTSLAKEKTKRFQSIDDIINVLP